MSDKTLNGISVAFRKRNLLQFGTSGSETTALNIIGGLDRYDSGDFIVKVRVQRILQIRTGTLINNSVDLYSSYNLITHLSIVANVELGMTLSGVSKSEKQACN